MVTSFKTNIILIYILILDKLFPRTEEAEETTSRTAKKDDADIEPPPVTEEEIRDAAKLKETDKALGLNAVAPVIIKAMANYRPDRIAALFNGIIRRRKMPDEWKQARAVTLLYSLYRR